VVLRLRARKPEGELPKRFGLWQILGHTNGLTKS